MSGLTIIFLPFLLLTDDTERTDTYGLAHVSDSLPICPFHSGQRNLCFRMTQPKMRERNVEYDRYCTYVTLVKPSTIYILPLYQAC